MIEVNIPKDFSRETGFRTYKDGPYSGQEFFEKLLKEKFIEANEAGDKIKVVLDGGEGYTSSFLNEAFRLLAEDFGSDEVWSRLVIVTNEWPKYLEKIKIAVFEGKK